MKILSDAMVTRYALGRRPRRAVSLPDASPATTSAQMGPRDWLGRIGIAIHTLAELSRLVSVQHD